VLVKEREMAINFREYRVKNVVVVIPAGRAVEGGRGTSRVWAIRGGVNGGFAVVICGGGIENGYNVTNSRGASPQGRGFVGY